MIGSGNGFQKVEGIGTLETLEERKLVGSGLGKRRLFSFDWTLSALRFGEMDAASSFAT